MFVVERLLERRWVAAIYIHMHTCIHRWSSVCSSGGGWLPDHSRFGPHAYTCICTHAYIGGCPTRAGPSTRCDGLGMASRRTRGSLRGASDLIHMHVHVHGGEEEDRWERCVGPPRTPQAHCPLHTCYACIYVCMYVCMYPPSGHGLAGTLHPAPCTLHPAPCTHASGVPHRPSEGSRHGACMLDSYIYIYIYMYMYMVHTCSTRAVAQQHP